MIRGDIAYALTSPIPFVSIVAERKVVALATIAKTRATNFPDVPTIYELGVPQLAVIPPGWWGIIAKTGTPREIIEKWNAAANAP
ncbi:MAG: hypothetical protein IPO58_15905 [Betaproteobacteria bacterium]|nr:hypothetical protein [Betaproteobacteria bacterium]